MSGEGRPAVEDGHRASRQAADSAAGGLHRGSHMAVHSTGDPLYSRRRKKGSAKRQDLMDYLPADEMTGLVV